MEAKKPATKKASGTTTTKRTYTKKPKPIVSEEKKTEAVVEPKVEIVEVPVVVAPTPAVEQPKVKKTIKQQLAEEEQVHYMIPYDPSLDLKDQYIEFIYCGIPQRFKRGEERILPVSIVKYIRERYGNKAKSEKRAAPYQTGSGVRIG